ncbi:cation:proton antiporter [bacterium]|nr:cation:proton antiporter [bacterium]
MNDFNFGILLLLGCGLFGGVLGAWFFQKIRFPQVIGYIFIGIFIGESMLRIVKHDDIERLQSFNWFALGIIGFLVGGELKLQTFKEYGKQFMTILFAEGMCSFFLVCIPVVIFLYMVTHSFPASLAGGIIFGAISSATDPASTIDVLWEYRAKGIMTTSIIAIVALDDALAMGLYGIGTSVADIISGHSVSVMKECLYTALNLSGSIIFGGLCGFLLKYIVSFFHYHNDKMLAFAIGILLLAIGIANMADIDVILVTMAMGFVIVNFAPKQTHELFELVKNFSVPIYVMFFVLVGARLSIANMPPWLWVVVVLYVAGRSIGKVAGTFWGARIAHAEEAVQKYAGLGLFAQGGIGIGLSIMASHHLSGIQITDDLSIGDMIVFVVTATTFILQMAGPALVKLSIKLSGEIHRNITEDDVIKSLTASDVMRTDIICIRKDENLRNIFTVLTSNDFLVYPVIESDHRIIGLITLENVKNILTDQDCWDWIIAEDVMIAVDTTLSASSPLQHALTTLSDSGTEQLPVIDSATQIPVGILDVRRAKKIIRQELIKKTAAIPVIMPQT